MAIFTLFYNKGVDKVLNVSFISFLKVVTNVHTSYTMNVLLWNHICTTAPWHKTVLEKQIKARSTLTWIFWCLDQNWISCKDKELQQYWYLRSRYLYLNKRHMQRFFSLMCLKPRSHWFFKIVSHVSHYFFFYNHKSLNKKKLAVCEFFFLCPYSI